MGDRRRGRMIRWIAVAVGEGALIGLLGGAAFGLWHSSLQRDLHFGTHFLLVLRLALDMSLVMLPCVALSATLLATGVAVRRRRSGRVAAAVIIGISAAAVIVVVMTEAWYRVLLALLRPPGTQPSTAWASAVPLAIASLAIIALRAKDALGIHGQGRVYPNRHRVRISAVGFLGAALLAAAHLALPVVAARRAAGHPSVVVISIDTLRADRLGAAGYFRALTPNLDRLADDGAQFLQATSTSPWTFPAHVSLFTSALPFDFGERIWRASPNFLMLAELFRNAGYRTAAYTGGTWVAARIGFDQGFESFESHDEIQEGGPAAYLAEAADWVEKLDGAPFLLFLHTYEPHVPYIHGDFTDPDASGRMREMFDYEDLQRLRDGSLIPDEQERRHVIALYDGDVAAADRFIGAFLDRLDELRPLDDTIVVVLSDHGEDLWDHVEHRSADHGHSLYEEQLRVPLIIRKTGDVRGGLEFHEPVSLIDVAPTVLELAGLPPAPQYVGRSLAVSLRTGVEPRQSLIFAEMIEYGPDRFSVRNGDLKVIVTPCPDVVLNNVHMAVDSVEVFDLERDPFERQNLFPGGHASWRVLAEFLNRRAEDHLHQGAPTSEMSSVPDELLEQMRALGYIR